MAVFDIVVPTFINGLKTFDHILAKTEEYAKEKDLDVDSFVDARLIDDMKPLSFQVQSVARDAQMALDRFEGKEMPPPSAGRGPADNDKTIAELRARIQGALERLTSAGAATAGEDDVIEMPTPNGPKMTTVKETVLNFALPNFFFHLQTGYAILRMKGVPLGKRDFLQSWIKF